HQERMLLERYTTEHAIGAVARVNCDALLPNSTWTKAQRTPVFRAVMEAVEGALENAVTRHLQTAPNDDGWRAWCLAAVKWETSEAGPLKRALPALEPFLTLDGRRVSIGAALNEFSRVRRVAVAGEGLEASGALVLRSTGPTLALLGALKLTVKDVSD